MVDPRTTGNSSQDDSSGKRTLADVPQLALPKGGGAIHGIGEKFAANSVTGTGSATIPIATSPGRSGFGPSLSLAYDSGAANNAFGFGWSVKLPMVTRKTDKGLPQYNDAENFDIFLLSDAEDLMPALIESKTGWSINVVVRSLYGSQYDVQLYRPRVEGLFARIERWTNVSDATDVFWRTISRDNVTTWFGQTADSRIADPSDPTRIFSWLISRSYDDKGNIIVYTWKAEDSEGVDLTQANERNRTASSRSAQRYIKNHQLRQPHPLPSQLCGGAASAIAHRLVLRGGLRLRRARQGCTDTRRSPALELPLRRILHLPVHVRGAHLPALQARADVPQLPRRKKCWGRQPCSLLRSPVRLRAARRPNAAFLFLSGIGVADGLHTEWRWRILLKIHPAG